MKLISNSPSCLPTEIYMFQLKQDLINSNMSK
uniref:Uncharacterized protein n=1 Tax=Rhizophora mucronata TaxID=61149 RepID=A0A2P2NBF7_RHIMU